MTFRPRVGITVGDPSGIGPEVAAKAAAEPAVVAACEPVLYGPATSDALEAFPAGIVSPESARAAHAAIVAAVDDAKAGRIHAIATAPIHKEAFHAAGLPWPGHTELLAELTGSRRVAMMFHSEPLRVVLATVHMPLARVPEAITPERLADVIDLTAEALPRFGTPEPRLALAGLNPHAGEGGVLGGEEIAVLAPAVEAARARGIRIDGPIPGDTVFVRASRGEFDAVIACYHDQGLIPVKLLAFGRAVNVTLGLPIVRTSADHGTAFDIARQGVADASSMIHAVLLAARLARGSAAP
jgi:4-hydroxythreonine-4-phosphate dehydrogenase